MRPFISYDGADANGVRAEVFVQAGSGVVTAIDGLEGDKRNVQVQIKSDHPAVTKPIKGWLQRTDPLLEKVVAAHQSQATVNYRTESQRKSHVDRGLPIGPLRETTDLARENCIQIFAGLDGVPSQEAVTNPAEDPAPGGRIPAGAQPSGATPASAPASGAPVDVTSALRAVRAAAEASMPEGVVHAAMAQALAAGASPADVNRAATLTAVADQPPAPQRAHATEAPRYRTYNTDGRINLGSFAVQAMFAAERFATNLIAEQHAAAADTDADVAPVDLRQAAALGHVIIGLADRVQVGAYEGGRVDRSNTSHTRARALVFEAIESRHPVPFGGDEEGRKAWGDEIVDECVQRFQHLASLSIQVDQPESQQEAPVEETSPQQAPQAVEQPAAGPVTPAQKPVDSEPAQQSAAQSAETGQDGFVAPSEDMLTMFASLAAAAGFEPTPDSPIKGYLQKTFGVTTARMVDASKLQAMLEYYRQQGSEAPGIFRNKVLTTANAS